MSKKDSKYILFGLLFTQYSPPLQSFTNPTDRKINLLGLLCLTFVYLNHFIMMLVDLRNLYKAQLIKFGVAESKAEQASESLSIQQLQIVMQIWQDFALVVNQSQNLVNLQKIDTE